MDGRRRPDRAVGHPVQALERPPDVQQRRVGRGPGQRSHARRDPGHDQNHGHPELGVSRLWVDPTPGRSRRPREPRVPHGADDAGRAGRAALPAWQEHLEPRHVAAEDATIAPQQADHDSPDDDERAQRAGLEHGRASSATRTSRARRSGRRRTRSTARDWSTRGSSSGSKKEDTEKPESTDKNALNNAAGGSDESRTLPFSFQASRINHRVLDAASLPRVGDVDEAVAAFESRPDRRTPAPASSSSTSAALPVLAVARDRDVERTAAVGGVVVDQQLPAVA